MRPRQEQIAREAGNPSTAPQPFWSRHEGAADEGIGKNLVLLHAQSIPHAPTRDECFKAIPFSSTREGELLMLDFKIESVKMLYAI